MYKKDLIGIGVPTGVLGFEYLNRAMEIFTPNRHMGDILQQVAKEFSTTQSKAERCIRHAFKKVEPDMNMKEFIALHKYKFDDKHKQAGVVLYDTAAGLTLDEFVGALKSFENEFGDFIISKVEQQNSSCFKVTVKKGSDVRLITISQDEFNKRTEVSEYGMPV